MGTTQANAAQIGTVLQGEYVLGSPLNDRKPTVYRGQRRRDGQQVAIRLLESLPAAVANLVLERAQRAQAVRHPSLGAVLDCGTLREGSVFVVSELVDGSPLTEWADTVGIPPLDKVVDFVQRLCEGLQLAKRHGLIHEALCPHNILVSPQLSGSGAASRLTGKLVDLGIPLVSRVDSLALEAALFMAPEQLRQLQQSTSAAVHVTSAANVYSVGCLLYLLCTGGAPYPVRNIPELLAAHAQRGVTRPSRINPQVPVPLNTIMVRALATGPTERYPSVAELGEALAFVVAGHRTAPPRARHPTSPPLGLFANRPGPEGPPAEAPVPVPVRGSLESSGIRKSDQAPRPVPQEGSARRKDSEVTQPVPLEAQAGSPALAEHRGPPAGSFSASPASRAPATHGAGSPAGSSAPPPRPSSLPTPPRIAADPGGKVRPPPAAANGNNPPAGRFSRPPGPPMPPAIHDSAAPSIPTPPHRGAARGEPPRRRLDSVGVGEKPPAMPPVPGMPGMDRPATPGSVSRPSSPHAAPHASGPSPYSALRTQPRAPASSRPDLANTLPGNSVDDTFEVGPPPDEPPRPRRRRQHSSRFFPLDPPPPAATPPSTSTSLSLQRIEVALAEEDDGHPILDRGSLNGEHLVGPYPHYAQLHPRRGRWDKIQAPLLAFVCVGALTTAVLLLIGDGPAPAPAIIQTAPMVVAAAAPSMSTPEPAAAPPAAALPARAASSPVGPRPGLGRARLGGLRATRAGTGSDRSASDRPRARQPASEVPAAPPAPDPPTPATAPPALPAQATPDPETPDSPKTVAGGNAYVPLAAPAPPPLPQDPPPVPVITTIDDPLPASNLPQPATEPLRASARVTDLEVTGSLATSVIRRSLQRYRRDFEACYKDAAKAAGKNVFGDIPVDFEIDYRGRVAAANARGGMLPGLAACVRETTSRVATNRPPDTGTVRASFNVTFAQWP